MKRKNLKILLIVLILGATLFGAFAYKEWTPTSHAANTHGDGHDHAEGEDSHDEGGEKHGHAHGEEDDHAEEGTIPLTAAQIAAAGIKIAPVNSGTLAREAAVPGRIVAAADRMAQIVPKVGGTVTEARRNLGDMVEKGEVLALIESREMAEAVADYLAASRAEELARTTFNREKGLWDKKITAEQDYLNARNAHQEAKIRLDLARQKLQALGHEGDSGKDGNTRFHALRSPLSGRVIARELTLGEYVDSTHSAYAVADLSIVWVETAIAPGDLPFVKEGQTAVIAGGANQAEGKLIFVSPAIDPTTRAAKAIIELDNAEGAWRPGEFVNAAIATAAKEADIIIPKDAIQTIEGKSAVFVRTGAGFEKRYVTTGREDSRYVEVMSGLSSGEPIAISGTFTLKAELGKSEAEHAH